jgi:hypothetical protein
MQRDKRLDAAAAPLLASSFSLIQLADSKSFLACAEI